jgi:hypothetical protein
MDVGGGGGKVDYDTDPLVRASAEKLIGLSDEVAGIGRSEYESGAARAAKYDPLIEEQMRFQTEEARKNAARSDALWDRYNELGVPMERRMAEDAMTWDSPDKIDRAAQIAEAVAARASAGARMTNARAMTSYGVNPGDRRFAAMMRGATLGDAAIRSGAMNKAIDDRINQGVTMRQNVGQFLRGLPATGVAANSLGLQGSGMSTNTGMSNVLMPGQVAGQSLPWYSLPMGGYSTGAGILQKESLAHLQADSANAQASASGMAGLGSLVGSLGSAAIFKYSSEELKEDKRPVSGERVLDGLEEIPVESWRYKKGVADEGKHIGPYAEDVQTEFGDRAAPGGKALDLVTMNGLALAAIKELTKKVKKLEAGGLDLVAAKRTTEPRRRVA